MITSKVISREGGRIVIEAVGHCNGKCTKPMRVTLDASHHVAGLKRHMEEQGIKSMTDADKQAWLKDRMEAALQDHYKLVEETASMMDFMGAELDNLCEKHKIADETKEAAP